MKRDKTEEWHDSLFKRVVLKSGKIGIQRAPESGKRSGLLVIPSKAATVV